MPRNFPLHAAARAGDAARIKELIEQGVDVNAPDEHGQSPLSYSIGKEGKDEAIVALLNAGANPGDHIYEALEQRRSISVIQAYMDAGADIGGADYRLTPFFRAAEIGYSAAIIVFLHSGADANEKTQHGIRPIHVAARSGHSRAVNALLSMGADPDIRCAVSKTAVEYATTSDRVSSKKVIELLLSVGADVGDLHRYGYSPLHDAAIRGESQNVTSLITKGDNLNSRSRFGSTPLHSAARGGNAKCVSELLSAGATVNAVDKGGSSPLHDASRGGRASAITILISSGAKINLRNKGGLTPLHLAARRGQSEAIETLTSHGAKINLQDNRGFTPLHHAVSSRHDKSISTLLECNANAKIKSMDGRLPIQMDRNSEVWKKLYEATIQ